MVTELFTFHPPTTGSTPLTPWKVRPHAYISGVFIVGDGTFIVVVIVIVVIVVIHVANIVITNKHREMDI